jgi:hypothetical protein
MLLSPSVAQVQPWSWGARQTLTHDNNLYRLSDTAVASTGASRSDTVSATTLSAGLDQTVSRQRLRAEAALDILRYAKNDQLDHEGHTLAVGWQGATVDRLSAEAWASRVRVLRPFDTRIVDGSSLRNIETSQAVGAGLRLGGEGRLTMEGGLIGRDVDFSARAAPTTALRSHSLQAGLRWRPEGSGTLGLGLRRTEGRYPELGDRWTTNAIDLSARWEPSGASQLWLRLSPLRARHARAEARDLSGLSGAAQWQWEPTGRLRLTARLLREAGADAGSERWGDSDVIVRPGSVDDARWLTRATLGLGYDIGAKTRAELTVGHTSRALVTLTPEASGGAAASGSDRTNQVGVGLRWAPWRSVELGCDASLERRTARGPLSTPYSAHAFGCFGSLALK